MATGPGVVAWYGGELFASFQDAAERGVFAGEAAPEEDYTLIHEGDELAAAASGLTTGYVHGVTKGGRAPSPTSVLHGSDSPVSAQWHATAFGLRVSVCRGVLRSFAHP